MEEKETVGKVVDQQQTTGNTCCHVHQQQLLEFKDEMCQKLDSLHIELLRQLHLQKVVESFWLPKIILYQSC